VPLHPFVLCSPSCYLGGHFLHSVPVRALQALGTPQNLCLQLQEQ